VVADDQLYYPAIPLKRSHKSETGKLLYSADVSRWFGKGSRLEIYVSQKCKEFPEPPPEEVSVMVLSTCPESRGKGELVRELSLLKEAGKTYRYEDYSGDLGTVYLPKSVFNKGPASETCYIHVFWK
jgi:hypothetical protein